VRILVGPVQKTMANSSARAPARLRVLTWNLWFSEFRMEQRALAALRHAQLVDAHIIAFQEVTPRCFEYLASDPWFNSTFTLSAKSPRDVSPYGCLLAVQSHLAAAFSCEPLPTRMERQLVRADLTLPDVKGHVQVATVHLESLSNRQTREQQLANIAGVLEGQPSILVGDFNFCSRREWSRRYRRDSDGVPSALLRWEKRGGSPPATTGLENDSLNTLLPDHIDLWLALRGAEHGFTFDTATNEMISQEGRYERMRYDRVLVSRQMEVHLRPAAIEIVGVDPLPAERGVASSAQSAATPVYVSDHFGLLATFIILGGQSESLSAGRPLSVGRPAARQPQPLGDDHGWTTVTRGSRSRRSGKDLPSSS